jgi:hypothetical protein
MQNPEPAADEPFRRVIECRRRFFGNALPVGRMIAGAEILDAKAPGSLKSEQF